MHTCPVCGYNELPHPPEDWVICPCCNTIFGYSDENWGADALRQEWIQAGAQWGSEDMAPPPNWSPVEQLHRIGYEVSDTDKIAIARARATNNYLVGFMMFELGQMQIITQRPTNLIGDQQDIVIRLNTFRQQRQSSDIQSVALQPA